MPPSVTDVRNLGSKPPGIYEVKGPGDMICGGNAINRISGRKGWTIVATDRVRVLDLRKTTWIPAGDWKLWFAGPWVVIGRIFGNEGLRNLRFSGVEFTYPIEVFDKGPRDKKYGRKCSAGIDRRGAFGVDTFGCIYREMGTMESISDVKSCHDYGPIVSDIGPSRSTGSPHAWHANTLSGTQGGIDDYTLEDFEWRDTARAATSIDTDQAAKGPNHNVTIRNGWISNFPNLEVFQFNGPRPTDGIIENIRLWDVPEKLEGKDPMTHKLWYTSWSKMQKKNIKLLTRKPAGDPPWKRWTDPDPVDLARFLLAMGGGG